MRLLLAVAKSGSLLKAAHEIGLSQPALSRSIANLEEAFRVRLFDRTNRGVVPTPHGAALLRRATRMFDELRQAVGELETLTSADGGELRIGATPTMCAAVLPCAVQAIRASRPKVRFLVEELESPRAASEVASCSLDLALGREHVGGGDPGLAFESMFDDRLFIVAGPRHPLVGRRSVALKEAARHEWVLPASDGAVMSHLNDELRRQGLDLLKPVVTTMSMLVRREMIATDSFLTLMYGSVLRFGSARESFRVLPIDLPGGIPIGITYLKDRTRLPIAELFVRTIRDLVRPMNNLSAIHFIRGRS